MTQAIIKKWWKENRCFLSIHKAFNFSMYSDLSLSISLSLSLSLLFLCIYQSFLSTYKDIIGKLSIHHIMFFAYGSSQRKWKPFFAGCYFSFTHKQKKLWSCPSVSKVCIGEKNYVYIMIK